MADSDASRAEYRYRAAWWLPGPHAQTLWGRFVRRAPRIPTASECLATPDGDNLEVHSTRTPDATIRVILLHGLEGSVNSHYVGGVLSQAARREWGASVLVFRGCGTAPNVARRFYHSGETTDLGFAFSTLSERWPACRWFLVGISLGGNVLLKWLGEGAERVDPRVIAAAAVSPPYDLEAGARKIATGFARIYDRSFLRSLRRKAIAKLDRYPDLFDRTRLQRARSVFEFDDAVTAPVHRFENARDYYARSSSISYLAAIRVPTLLLSAADDPFLPVEASARAARTARSNPSLTVELHARGGHVGFVSGARPWRPHYYGEWRAFDFFDAALEQGMRRSYD
jgi:predicted alpha/beta-fold hydrolase